MVKRKNNLGTHEKEIISIPALGVSQKIFQSRLDNATAYTSKLTHRFNIVVDDSYINALPFIDMSDVDSADVKYPIGENGQSFKVMRFAVLKLERIQYNRYILELGEVLRR